MEKKQNKYRIVLICAALVFVSLAAYEPVRHNEFIVYDDYSLITENPHIQSGFNLESIRWAFTTYYWGNWHPLTWLSHMLDYELFGLNAAGHHFVNLFLHIISTLLLFWILKQMTGGTWSSAFVACVFAIHPQHVESVAWASERKDVLSALFWMATIAAYIRYSEKPGIGRYLLVLVSMALGLMSKGMVVTLPFVLLLLDYWPLRRFTLPGESVKSRYSAAGPL
ncbi:MAG: ArnT family glycosyltransferase, partial [Planctomycetota bacterium]